MNNRAVLWVHVAAAASIRSPDLQRLFAFLISLFSWEFRSPYRRHLAFSLLLLLSLPLAPRRHRASLSLPAPLPPSLEIYANTRNDSPPKPFLTNGFLLGEGEGGRDLSIPVHPTPEFRRLPLRTWKIEFPFESFRPKNLTEKKKKIFSSRKLLETCSIRSCPLPSPFPTRFHPESDSLYRDSKCKRHPSSRLNRNRGQTVWPEIFICKSSSRCRVWRHVTSNFPPLGVPPDMRSSNFTHPITIIWCVCVCVCVRVCARACMCVYIYIYN